MAEIVLDNLTKRFPDGTEAVSGLSLQIADGELMIFVGPSGCGKSTALRMIAGLEDISDGEIRIGDQVVNELDPKDRDIAMVFQNYALYPHMSVRDNMGFALRLRKLPQAEIDEKVEKAAKTLGLTEYLDRKPANLSGGQRQRVAMGRAIVRQPAAFLMDEPLSNLDAKLRVQMRSEVAALQARLGTTTIYVTHDQTEAMTLGDRVAVLRAGKLQQVASPIELYEQPKNLFVAGFIGSPAMNFLPARIEGDQLSTAIGNIPMPPQAAAAAAKAGPLVIGIRPEHFADAKLLSKDELAQGATFTTRVELVEAMGSERVIYFDVDDAGIESADLADLAKESDVGDLREDSTTRMVARLSPESTAGRQDQVELWVDTSKVHLFDTVTGQALDLQADASA